jgi:hypothetical protein
VGSWGQRVWRWGAPVVFGVVALASTAYTETGRTFRTQRASFAVEVGGQRIDDRVGSAFVLPGERLPLAILAALPSQRFHVTAAQGTLRGREDRWSWTAPNRPGLYPLSIVEEDSGQRTRLNAFVMVPSKRVHRGALNGYPIGSYPRGRGGVESFYQAPVGFIEVTRENQDTELSPHFRLRQFVCKQGSRYPKYVVLRPELLTKLEGVLEALNARGIEATTLAVMSGYRTPRYNRSLGNTRFSAHLWGGAADVFVDEDGDGVMDDLNGDGRIDARDTLVLSEIVEQIESSESGIRLIGGLGRYHSNEAHGPFVHVDVRGYRARWGG